MDIENNNNVIDSPGFVTKYKLLSEVFPEAASPFLAKECRKYYKDSYAFERFVSRTVRNRIKYPMKKEQERDIQLQAQIKRYTTDFSIQGFLEEIPNPKEYFEERNKEATVLSIYGDSDEDNEKIDRDMDIAYAFLKNQFKKLSARDIRQSLQKTKSVFKTANIIKHKPPTLLYPRKTSVIEKTDNIPLLREMAYIKHEKEILFYIEQQKNEKLQRFNEAKETGSLKTCECCYDEEVMPEESVTCEAFHTFCKPCVQRNCEVLFADGKLDFPCLQNCAHLFPLSTLQNILKPTLFSRITKRKQIEEVKAAGIEDVEYCQYCDFAAILDPEDRFFNCLNPECLKISCRLCKEEAHIPLRCDEVEKDEDVKRRLYIENRMTEALVRTCYKCQMKYIKSDGCNKMTCSCGASMCYLCNQPVTDYKHFNGPEGDQHQLCPLFTNTTVINYHDVKKAAKRAKRELGIEDVELKQDPTKNLSKYFNKKKRYTT